MLHQSQRFPNTAHWRSWYSHAMASIYKYKIQHHKQYNIYICNTYSECVSHCLIFPRPVDAMGHRSYQHFKVKFPRFYAWLCLEMGYARNGTFENGDDIKIIKWWSSWLTWRYLRCHIFSQTQIFIQVLWHLLCFRSRKSDRNALGSTMTRWVFSFSAAKAMQCLREQYPWNYLNPGVPEFLRNNM